MSEALLPWVRATRRLGRVGVPRLAVLLRRFLLVVLVVPLGVAFVLKLGPAGAIVLSVRR